VGNRTPDLLIANEALYHLSYGPFPQGGGGAEIRDWGWASQEWLGGRTIIAPASLRAPGAVDTKGRSEGHGLRMHAILDFSEYIIQGLLSLIVWVVVAYAILSWLIAFNVVNLRNRAVWQISRFLDAVVRPVLRPFQRFLPNFGGMDFSPILLFLVIGGVQRFLVPAFFNFLHGLVGGSVI
jgi:YggT family protein